MDVLMAGPWMLSPQRGLDHGHHHGWAMDAVFLRTDQTMDVIMHGRAMDALFSKQIRPSFFCATVAIVKKHDNVM